MELIKYIHIIYVHSWSYSPYITLDYPIFALNARCNSIKETKLLKLLKNASLKWRSLNRLFEFILYLKENLNQNLDFCKTYVSQKKNCQKVIVWNIVIKSSTYTHKYISVLHSQQNMNNLMKRPVKSKQKTFLHQN